MKIAIVHEWLDTYAGSERVLEQLLKVWPEADLFVTCDFLPAAQRGFLGGVVPRTSFIQRLPRARRHFRKYLGLMPLAVEQHDLSGYAAVISSSHAVAHGVITAPGQPHLSYVHSPMRYAWDMQAQYLRESGMERGLKGAFARWQLHRLRHWTRSAAAGVDLLIANSGYIAERIMKVWRRESTVVHPPVDLERFALRREKQDHYVIASRMVPYKRIELVAGAFRRMPERRLVIVGDGPNAGAVREAAAGAPNIDIRGRVPTPELVSLLQSARAALFAAEEDFGIATVEAQACGTPVIAFGKGGARDIVVPPQSDGARDIVVPPQSDGARDIVVPPRSDGAPGTGSPPPGPAPTGLFFDTQTEDAVIDAVTRFEARSAAFTPEACRRNAERFSEPVFRDRMRALVEAQLR